MAGAATVYFLAPLYSPVQWQWYLYNEPLQHPLVTAHGTWRSRQGIYLRLENAQGEVGYGEIAPLPAWGTETLGRAITFCQQLPRQLTTAIITAIPEALPATQFGFATAWHSVGHLPYGLRDWPLCGLLGSGALALEQWLQGWRQGYRTFKWKVGVAEPAQEQAILADLLRELPAGVKLRLDANGGWDWPTAVQWLTWLEDVADGILEFVEQPLPVGHAEELLALAQRFQIPLALDESVMNWRQLRAWQARQWPGLYILKPALLGSPERLHQCLAAGLRREQVVFSSALEGAIARTAIFALLEAWQPQYALGFGVERWRPAPLLTSLAAYAAEWQRLDNYGRNYYK